METANNNQESKLKMGKEKKKKQKKKGKLRRALKKVFRCFFPWASSKSKIFSDEDVYELSSSETQMVPRPSRETEKVSATETQKPRKSFFATLKAKKSKKILPAQPRPVALLGGAAVILVREFSDKSDKVDQQAAQGNTTIPEQHTGLQMTHAPSITSTEAINASSEEKDLSSSTEFDYDNELDDVSEDFDAPFTHSSSSNDISPDPLVPDPKPVNDLWYMKMLSILGNITLNSVESDDSDGLMEEEILQLIQSSNESPNNQQKKDYDGQDLKYMGFPNIGNTCYMNSTLQCFFSITPIIEDIIYQENHWKKVPETKMLRAFYDLHYARLNKTQTPQLLATVKQCIAMTNPDFDGNYQQDAHEFLMTLVAQLKDETEKCQESEKTFRSPVAHLEFMVSRVRTCKTCGNQSCSAENVNCLSLVMGPQKSLTESLQQYFASSQLECRCGTCQGTEATESVAIQTLPRVLVLLIMRFDSSKKIEGGLTVPEELSLSSFTGSDSCEQAENLYSKEAKDTQQAHSETNAIQQQDDTTYKLNGVVSHHGSSLHCGHYVSNIRDPCGAEWLSCNDGTVKSVNWSNVSKAIENHGYIFFYLRS